IVFDDTKIAYTYDPATATATQVLDTSARHRFAVVEGASSDGRYVAVATNLYSGTSYADNSLYRADTQSSDPPILADVDNTNTHYDSRWILAMGMSKDAHNIAFTIVYAGDTNGAYLRTGLP